MILPSTYVSTVILLVISLLCFGLWVNTFKLAGLRWRFELFYVDFAVGTALFAIAAALTFGSLGSDLAFSDRMLVAGRTAQGMVVLSGAIFNLGNMLLLAAASLLGIASAFPLSVGVALIVTTFFHFQAGNILLLVGGIDRKSVV